MVIEDALYIVNLWKILNYINYNFNKLINKNIILICLLIQYHTKHQKNRE